MSQYTLLNKKYEVRELENGVRVRGEFKATTTPKLSHRLGKLKNWPSGSRLMIPAIAWSYDRSQDTVIQIDGTGNVDIIQPVEGRTYTFDKTVIFYTIKGL